MGGRELYGGTLDLTPLKLSEEQKQTIRQIREESRQKARELRRLLKEKKAALGELLFSAEATPAEIKSQIQELSALRQQMEEIVMGDFIAVRSVLTAEQRELLPQIKPQRRRTAGDGTIGRQAPGPGGRGLPTGRPFLRQDRGGLPVE